MGREYKYVGNPPGLIAADAVICCFCNVQKIKPGDPYYFEVTERKPVCRPCARLINKHGVDEARTKVGAFSNLFKSVFGSENPFEGM